MALIQYTNNAATTLNANITNSQTSITVTTGGGALFPSISGSQFFFMTLENAAGTVREIVKVTARSGDTFTIVRAQDNTTAQSFSSGDKVEQRVIAKEMNAISSGIATGGGDDQVFFENQKTVTTNYTISTGRNAMTAGPVTINSGITVTIPSGSRWVVL